MFTKATTLPKQSTTCRQCNRPIEIPGQEICLHCRATCSHVVDHHPVKTIDLNGQEVATPLHICAKCGDIVAIGNSQS